jgi:hypothetical protein
MKRFSRCGETNLAAQGLSKFFPKHVISNALRAPVFVGCLPTISAAVALLGGKQYFHITAGRNDLKKSGTTNPL